MKAFNLFLADLNDGQTHAGLTADLDDLLRTETGYTVLVGKA